MAESGSNVKTAAITVISTLALAMGYNYLGVDSSGRKINDEPEKPKTEVSDSDKLLKMRELEIKEKELALKMRQLELSQNKGESTNSDITD